MGRRCVYLPPTHTHRRTHPNRPYIKHYYPPDVSDAIYIRNITFTLARLPDGMDVRAVCNIHIFSPIARTRPATRPSHRQRNNGNAHAFATSGVNYGPFYGLVHGGAGVSTIKFPRGENAATISRRHRASPLWLGIPATGSGENRWVFSRSAGL